MSPSPNGSMPARRLSTTMVAAFAVLPGGWLLPAPAGAEPTTAAEAAALGRAAFEAGQHEEALEHLERAQRRTPDAELMVMLAEANRALRRWDDAYNWFEGAVLLGLDPDAGAAAKRALRRLTPRVAIVDLTVRPTDAWVHLGTADTEPIGRGSRRYALPPGAQSLVLRAHGFRDRLVEVAAIVGGVPVSLSIVLEQVTGHVTIRVADGGRGKVSVRANDGSLVADGRAPLAADVPPGAYEVVVERPGHRPARRILKVEGDGAATWDADLEPVGPRAWLAAAASPAGVAALVVLAGLAVGAFWFRRRRRPPGRARAEPSPSPRAQDVAPGTPARVSSEVFPQNPDGVPTVPPPRGRPPHEVLLAGDPDASGPLGGLDDWASHPAIEFGTAPTLPPNSPRESGAHLVGSTLPPGTMLDERYRVERLLGQGGMGEVYVVEDVDTGAHQAAKVLAEVTAWDDDAVRRFELEARATQAIEDEHVVTVSHLARTPGGRVFLIMELLKGEDLAARMRRARDADGLLPFEETRRVVTQTLDGLVAAHAAGVLHRDLKPDNLFLHRPDDRPFVVKILDFGVSKIVSDDAGSSLTRTGQVLGTPLYMSPEQALGQRSKTGPAADQFALGVLAYELLTGERPFGADTLGKLLVQITKHQPEPPRALRPEVPEGVEAVVLRALEKAPADRFPDAAAMRDAWESAWDRAPDTWALG